MPKKVTIFHKETGAAELYSIDAREALNNHPGEWRDRPWPNGDEAKDAKKADSKADAKKD